MLEISGALVAPLANGANGASIVAPGGCVPRDPNCCPAMKATRTTSTDAAMIHAGGPDRAPPVGAAGDPAAAPHEWQNRAPAESGWPHDVHGAVVSAAPQSAQYCPVAGSWHRGQGVVCFELVTE